jgi:hypothetical protein
MRPPSPVHSYPESCYDEQLCLKPPLLLWVAVLYLSRAVTLPIAMAIAHFSGVDARAIAVMRGYWSLEGLVPAAFAVAILYALLRRVPAASAPVRWVWARGRTFLAVAAILDIALLSIALVRHGEIDDSWLISGCAAVLDVYLLVYIIAARRVRDTFSEFPARLDPPPPRKAGTGRMR